MSARILYTASRTERDLTVIAHDLTTLWIESGSPHACTLIHGACEGGDLLAHRAACDFGWHIESYPADNFAVYGDQRWRIRNQYMVHLGADICGARARSWGSGTGMCARMARRAGIRLIDFGVDTRTRVEMMSRG